MADLSRDPAPKRIAMEVAERYEALAKEAKRRNGKRAANHSR